jgi:DNA-binding transcriptional ArsR family regulator
MISVRMDEPTRERASLLFSALSHPVRLQIAETLADGEKTVGEIAEAMGIGQSGASQHLALLARAGVLSLSKRGTHHFYRLRGPRIARILGLIAEFCEVHGLHGSDAIQEGE